MAILCTADWHLSDNPRDAYRFNGIKTIREIAKEHKVSHTVVLGDVTEEKDRHSAWLTNQVVEEVDKFASICELIFMKGNHDYVLEEWPFFRFLRRIPGVTWINKPTFTTKLIPPLRKVLFLPHTNNWQEWDPTDIKYADWIFAHNTFQGANVGNRRLDGIPTNIFPSIENKVFAGDIHVPQKVGPVTYVGAPYTVDFGDDYEPRVLLIDGTKVKSVPVPGVQKRLIEIKGYTSGPHKDKAKAGDIVKIRVNLESGEYAKWAEIREHTKRWANELGLIVYSIHPIVDKAQVRRTKQVKSKLSDEEMVRGYVREKDIDGKTEAVGLKLLEA